MKKKVDVLKRRFKIKKTNKPEKINPFGEFKSKYAHLTTSKYFDSDQFAMYEAGFSLAAREFYIKSGADKYNHDALDLEIDKRVYDEHKHYDEQCESHLAVLDDLNIGVEVEKVSVDAKIEQVNQRLDALRVERDELNARYNSFNRRVG